MWSFIATLFFFVVITVSGVIAHYRQRRELEPEFKQSEKAILTAGEIAQRRHVEKFGKEDTGLHVTLAVPTRPPTRAERKHQKA